MSSNFKVLSQDSEFQLELNKAGPKVVVADFTSSRCPPCQQIAPAFEALAAKYSNAIFLKIDTQICPGAARLHGVTATPTFIIFKNKTKVDSIRGANIKMVETKIDVHYWDEDSEETEDCGVPGHMDLLCFVNKAGCECLNESDSHPFSEALISGDYLESDTDEQLIWYISFSQSIKLHSLRLKAPLTNGPKHIKLYINQPYTLDFDAAETGIAVQEFDLTPKELSGELILLKYVRFQSVMNLSIFIKDNQSDAETTRIDSLQLIGSPVQTTNMSDFKRIAGKKGESH